MDNMSKVALGFGIVLILVFIGLVLAKPSVRALAECKDSMDNDGDGNIDFPADSGCDSKNDKDETDCGDGVCEGGENQETCPQDCGYPTTTTTTVTTTTTTTLPADSCSDTDGGVVYTVQGTVSGYSSGSPYGYTDYCFGGNVTAFLYEYYCLGSQWRGQGFDCANISMTCVGGACV